MAWYTAKCLFRVEQRETVPGAGMVGEYRYILVSGEDQTLAMSKANHFAKAKEHTYQNAAGGTTVWILDSVVGLKELFASEFVDGIELYSEYLP